ncbi:Fic family protein [Chelatococcus asaccharovorans]|uniref:Fic family protein n=1 Tax=Chelatococcus asaccharovorans TaxID=28210 RepID=A0A2V3TUF2_9HYPH|nr:Fic family protein [Chelatococcus asaccharovorans]MBS7708101.1 Fic family protein [Chelatococcus asaccharovorans]PXW51589.1 Fic family protein [Chelatococcus asaccharovorans]
MLETPARIEPLFFDDAVPTVLADLAIELQKAADELGRGLHPESAAELADLVRVMNSYYSNLIEGHNTRPKDIEMALAGAEIDPERRPLALEAKAHVEVQRMIDGRALRNELPSPTSMEFIRWVHRAFYDEMPAEFRYVEKPDGTKVDIVPGEFRTISDHDVAVGRHQPPSSSRVIAFMEWFQKRFAMAEKQASLRIIAIASAHHRLNYIHPFPDGNGRVSRLMSHAMALKAGIGGNGLWSISRGLARGLKDRGEYKRMMDHADSPRQGDRDGRGNLSESALKDFVEWFLTAALDQVRFSTAMFDLTRLEARYRALVKDVVDDKRAPDLVSAVLRHGSLPRGEANFVLKTSERTARNTLSDLVDRGFLKSDTPKAPVRIAFPLDFRERLFPNLFTDADVTVPEPPSLSFR